MRNRRLHVSLGVASVALVLTAAAMSRNDRWNFDFAQYKGPDRPEPRDEFRFVMVGDRNGGRVPGLMPQAFREINHLYPDFVISVGDLIDGPTNSTERIGQFWKEFDDEVALLKSPFVYVPGNHDIWNTTSKGIYEERYGATYRSFNYRGLHFITLDTEEMDETGRKIDRITGKQLEWLKEDLERNRNARRILVFLHKPIWLRGGLDEAEKLWKGMPVHVFAGHDHRYSYQEIDGIPHVILGAVAGGMREEGEPLGRFRHYVLATVRDDDLKLALIRLGGVLPPDTVLEQELPGIRLLADACGLYSDTDGGSLKLSVRNPLACDVRFQVQKTSYGTGKPTALSLFRASPVTLNANAILDQAFEAAAGGSAEHAASEFKATYEFVNAQGQLQKIDFPIEVRRRRSVQLTTLASAPAIDGDLTDWANVSWQAVNEPVQLATAGRDAWRGPEDLAARFALAFDEQHLFVAVEVTDDTVSFNTLIADSDGFELYMAGPTTGEISFARDPDWRQIVVTPFAQGGLVQGDPKGIPHSVAYGSNKLKPTQAAYSRGANGYTIELAFSRQELGWTDSRDQNRQFEISINDRDRGTRRESQLVWSGNERTATSSRYYGRVLPIQP